MTTHNVWMRQRPCTAWAIILEGSSWDDAHSKAEELDRRIRFSKRSSLVILPVGDVPESNTGKVAG